MTSVAIDNGYLSLNTKAELSFRDRVDELSLVDKYNNLHLIILFNDNNPNMKTEILLATEVSAIISKFRIPTGN